MATKEQGAPVRDFTPRVFIRKMKFEIALVAFGVCAAFMLPSIMRARTASRAGPQDAYTAKYLQKQKEEQMAEAQMMKNAGQVPPPIPTGYKLGQAPPNKYDAMAH